MSMAILASCKKDSTTTTPTNNNNNNNGGCGDGNVCFKLNGTQISKTGGGYLMADTFTFVKYEEGAKQLSIDIFGNTTGSYTVGDKRLKGRGRIYYFPETSKMYMSNKGSLEMTELTSDRKATGKFSGTLYRYNGDTETFTMTDSMVITEGFFTKVQLAKL
ncbi:hypothetical protein CAP35_00855 [Chitinophagaceae bacterium IBVUCB1]|nr:hypothetical protein CAP35_00855 [Chitinophagaceae bacterium IBVUCB1]